MKYLTTFAFVASLAGIAGMAACSSGSDSDSGSSAGSGNTSAGGAGTGGSGTAGTPAAGAAFGGAATAGAPAGGAPAGGSSTGGAATGGAGAGGGAGKGGTGGGGAGGTSGGGAGGTSGGGTSGGGAGGGSNAVVATCVGQVYTPTASPGGSCATSAAPTVPLISSFDDGTAAGWGAYANGAGAFTNGAPTPTTGGANNTAKALSFTVNQSQGIRIEAGFGTCQDVRTFQGLSFWAKGTIDAATVGVSPNQFSVDANTLVITLGSEKSAQGGCTSACVDAPDRRVTITADWKEYRVPFNCFGPDGTRFDGYFKDILFNAYGTMSNFAIDQVGYY